MNDREVAVSLRTLRYFSLEQASVTSRRLGNDYRDLTNCGLEFLYLKYEMILNLEWILKLSGRD